MQVGLLCKKTQCLVLSLLLSLSFQASIIDDLRSTYKIINMEDLFARLDTGDKYLQERYAKFQARMQKQINNMHSGIESLNIRITVVESRGDTTTKWDLDRMQLLCEISLKSA